MRTWCLQVRPKGPHLLAPCGVFAGMLKGTPRCTLDSLWCSSNLQLRTHTHSACVWCGKAAAGA